MTKSPFDSIVYYSVFVDGADGTNGSDGAPGADGADGADGASAYQIWLAAGNTGTEADFLAALKGADGAVMTGQSQTITIADVVSNIVTLEVDTPPYLIVTSTNIYPIEKGSLERNASGAWRLDLTRYLAYDNLASYPGAWTVWYAGGAKGDKGDTPDVELPCIARVLSVDTARKEVTLETHAASGNSIPSYPSTVTARYQMTEPHPWDKIHILTHNVPSEIKSASSAWIGADGVYTLVNPEAVRGESGYARIKAAIWSDGTRAIKYYSNQWHFGTYSGGVFTEISSSVNCAGDSDGCPWPRHPNGGGYVGAPLPWTGGLLVLKVSYSPAYRVKLLGDYLRLSDDADLRALNGLDDMFGQDFIDEDRMSIELKNYPRDTNAVGTYLIGIPASDTSDTPKAHLYKLGAYTDGVWPLTDLLELGPVTDGVYGGMTMTIGDYSYTSTVTRYYVPAPDVVYDLADPKVGDIGILSGMYYIGSDYTTAGRRYALADSAVHNRIDTVTTSGTYTAPVTGWYKVTMIGGGGGGGASYYNSTDVTNSVGGGGGGSGGITTAYTYLATGATLTVTIGAGGEGGAANVDGYATDGGNTVVTELGHANGGNKGLGGWSGVGGAGADAGQLYGTVRGLARAGSPGSAYHRTLLDGRVDGGSGGGSGGGVGTNAAGGAAKSPGGGGGGSGIWDLSAQTGYVGGAGADGIVYIEYYQEEE